MSSEGLKPHSSMEYIQDKLQLIEERVSSRIVEISIILSRLYGEAESDANNPVEPDRPGLYGDIEDKIDRILTKLDVIAKQIIGLKL